MVTAGRSRAFDFRKFLRLRNDPVQIIAIRLVDGNGFAGNAAGGPNGEPTPFKFFLLNGDDQILRGGECVCCFTANDPGNLRNLMDTIGEYHFFTGGNNFDRSGIAFGFDSCIDRERCLIFDIAQIEYRRFSKQCDTFIEFHFLDLQIKHTSGIFSIGDTADYRRIVFAVRPRAQRIIAVHRSQSRQTAPIPQPGHILIFISGNLVLHNAVTEVDTQHIIIVGCFGTGSTERTHPECKGEILSPLDKIIAAVKEPTAG